MRLGMELAQAPYIVHAASHYAGWLRLTLAGVAAAPESVKEKPSSLCEKLHLSAAKESLI